jgi:hypothetical protein
VSAPIGGGQVRELWPDKAQIYSIAQDENYLYWTTNGADYEGGSDGRLRKLKKPDP